MRYGLTKLREKEKKNPKNRHFLPSVSYHLCRALTSSDVELQLPPNVTCARIVSEISKGVLVLVFFLIL